MAVLTCSLVGERDRCVLCVRTSGSARPDHCGRHAGAASSRWGVFLDAVSLIQLAGVECFVKVSAGLLSWNHVERVTKTGN